MLPEYQKLIKDELDRRPTLCKTSFQKFSVITVSLPLFSFVFCVAYSLIYYFHESTSTHCHTWNYLPSISVSINTGIFTGILSGPRSGISTCDTFVPHCVSQCNALSSFLSLSSRTTFIYVYWPSLRQAAIGQFQPQSIVWQICIIIHFIPRLIITWMYKRWANFIRTLKKQDCESSPTSCVLLLWFTVTMRE